MKQLLILIAVCVLVWVSGQCENVMHGGGV